MKNYTWMSPNSEVTSMQKATFSKTRASRVSHRWIRFWMIGIFLAIPFSPAFARSSYVSIIPYGNVLSCNACHTSSFSLNSFARDFRNNGNRWNAALAQKDSDGDGATNGLELQDPAGSWVRGDVNPGAASAVTNPGDASSVPVSSSPTNTPTSVAIPPTHTPTPDRTVGTPTPSPVDSTPTPTASEPQPTPIGDDFAAGVWTGQTVYGNETYDWRFVLGRGIVVGTLTSIFHSDDEGIERERDGDEDDDEWESEDDRDDDVEHEADVAVYQIDGTYSLRIEGEIHLISMQLTIANEAEMDSGDVTGTIDLVRNVMTLHGFDDLDTVIVNRTEGNPHPQDPTATPTVTPMPGERQTPTPIRTEPYLVHRFEFNSQDEFTVIPGGFDQAEPAVVQLGSIPFESMDYTDGRGVAIIAQPGEVGLIQLQSVDVEDSLVLIRASVMTDEEDASVALAVLDGTQDGSIAMTMSMNSVDYQDGYHRIVVVYDPPRDSVIPIVQLANPESNDSNVALYVDNVEVFTIPKQGFTSNLLLNGM